MIQTLQELKTVTLDEERNCMVVLDQTLLPGEERYESIDTVEGVYDAIKRLKVRGAPAIGIAAAYGLYVCSSRLDTDSRAEFVASFKQIKERLASSRPTAVNLFAALDRMEEVLKHHPEASVVDMKTLLHDEAVAIRTEDAESCRAIARNGLQLLRPGMGLLTHCNAGHLAVSEYGTALAPIYLGTEQGYGFKVYADETRPLLQGARLTVYELQRAGVDVTLLCDNMAASLMQKGKIDAVLVGCDRVAANGDVANKIGTLGVALMAKHYGIPFYVLGPTSTIDRNCPNGEAICIEQRQPEEVTDCWYAERMAPKGCKVYNPAFDVTPHDLITAFVSEKGIFEPGAF